MDPDLTHLPVRYNVFIYTSRGIFRPGTSSIPFSLTLHGMEGITDTNVFMSPGTSFGSMLHLVHHSKKSVGMVTTVEMALRHPKEKWHVSRVIISDAIEQEDILVPVSDWVTSSNKTWSARGSHPLRYYPGQVLLKMMANVPIFLLSLPGRMREKKVDNVLAYTGATVVWAILRLWFYQQGHPFYRPDDCFHIEIPLMEKLIPQLIQQAINFGLSILFFGMFHVVVSKSLMSKEEKC